MITFERPLIFFDLETTGTSVANDRIITLAMRKYTSLDKWEEKAAKVNPTIPIPKEATDVHGISDADVVGCPLFSQISKGVYHWTAGCDFAGYNIKRFDVPLLAEEFHRAGMSWPQNDAKFFDAQSIFFKKEERTLSAAVKFYCNGELTEAHNATADVAASADVFFAQLNKYEDIGSMDEEQLDAFCSGDERWIDLSGNFIIDGEGDAIFSRGKHKGKKCSSQKGYLQWMIRAKDDETGLPIYPATTLLVAERLLKA